MDDAGSSEPDGDEDGDELREPGGDILHENNWTSPQWSEYKMVIRREQEQWSSIPLLRAKANWKTVGWGSNSPWIPRRWRVHGMDTMATAERKLRSSEIRGLLGLGSNSWCAPHTPSSVPPSISVTGRDTFNMWWGGSQGLRWRSQLHQKLLFTIVRSAIVAEYLWSQLCSEGQQGHNRAGCKGLTRLRPS